MRSKMTRLEGELLVTKLLLLTPTRECTTGVKVGRKGNGHEQTSHGGRHRRRSVPRKVTTASRRGRGRGTDAPGRGRGRGTAAPG